MTLKTTTLALLMISLRLGSVVGQSSDEAAFQETVMPVLQSFCGDCHADDDSNSSFLSAASVDELVAAPGHWRNVANQLANRTMPPADERQPRETDRIRIASWISRTLQRAALQGDDYAGIVTTRRLNRREYANTIRDLCGVELDLATTLPVDSGGGEGFDNNGETLFLPPLLLERYLETAQQVVDAAIIPSPMKVMYLPADMHLESSAPKQSIPGTPDRVITKTINDQDALTIPPKTRVSVLVPISVAGDYEIPVGIVPPIEGELVVQVEIDEIPAGEMKFRRYEQRGIETQETVRVRLARGLHKVSIRGPGNADVRITRFRVVRIPAPVTPVQIARHMQLMGVRPGHTPPHARGAAIRTLRRFALQAFRRPATDAEVDRLMTLYDAAEQRGDSFEERIKFALKCVLVSPHFLFRIEQPPVASGIEPLNEYELATRLSYFLWSTMPDDELRVLARSKLLNHDKTLDEQVDRLLSDPRAAEFFSQFVGQWWGTRDLGGRRAATENAIQNIYTPFIAADMRAQAVLLFEHIVKEDRSVLELLDSDYTFLTGKLAKFYRMEFVGDLPRDEFRHVRLPNPELAGRFGGVMGLGAVLTLTSHISQRETSPVLRGAWVLDNLLGTRIPAPPDDVPPLDRKARKQKKLSLRETLELHRADKSCAACHQLIDPIGFGLENFDFLGRWRTEDAGKAIDSVGILPDGTEFEGPLGLKKVLLDRKQDFLRQLVRKLLGYALGRSLVDADEVAIQRLIQHLEENGYRGRSLIKAIVRSIPFRNQSLPKESFSKESIPKPVDTSLEN